jgi:MFS family permease
MDDAAPPAPSSTRQGITGRKVLLAIVGAVLVVLAWLLAASVIPRWWAQRVGSLVDGRMTIGSFAGVVSGAAFTFLPLLALWAGFRFRKGWRRVLAWVLIAVVIGLPNLFLLGIVFGSGNAAHAGERILDVEGPGFRGASLVGAILGGTAFFALLYLVLSRKARGRRAASLQGQLRDRERQLGDVRASQPEPET